MTTTNSATHNRLSRGYLGLLEAHPEACLVLVGSRGETQTLAYQELAARASRVATGLRAAHVSLGDRVVLALPTGADYVSVLLGCLLAGGVPATVALPSLVTRQQNRETASASALRQAVATVRPRVTVVPRGSTDAARAAVDDLVLDPELLLAHEPASIKTLPRQSDDQPHHVQLTSGSTARPKAAVLTYGAVAANLAALEEVAGFDPARDRLTNWLPLYHDMGLIQLLFSLSRATFFALMQPVGFLRDPLAWLHLVSACSGTIAAAPPFALRACVDRFDAKRALGLDLSHWRRLFVGAEPVQGSTLSDFNACLAPYGLRPDAVYPCYGMAETVLATTLPTVQQTDGPWAGTWIREHRLDADTLRGHGCVVKTESPHAVCVLGMGTAAPGLELQVRSEAGEPLPDRHVGQVSVRGTSLMAGYLGEDPTTTFDAEGWFATGDSGYLDEGQVFILGRLKETLIVRGRNYPPQAVEDILESHPHVGPGHSLVFARPSDRDGLDEVVAMVETRESPASHAELVTELGALTRARLGFNLADTVVAGPGSLPRTTSGKKQRLAARRVYLAQRNRQPVQPEERGHRETGESRLRQHEGLPDGVG